MRITQQRLKEVLDYDPVTGIFTWRLVTSNRIKVGAIAGHPTDRGYVSIGVDGARYRAHHLAWLYVYGFFPPRLDHKDNVRNHNWIDNLRISTASQNQFNSKRPVTNTSGFKGVCRAGKRWRAKIWVSNKDFHLGTFDLPEQAHAAYCEAAIKYHGEFARFE